MTYPQHLLPKPIYRYITDLPALAGRALIRFTPKSLEDFADTITGLPHEREIEPYTKNMMDLSTSLVGVFQVEDARYLVQGNRKGYFVFEPWPVGEEITQPPKPEEFIIRSNGTFYYLPIDDVQHYEVPFSTADGEFNATLRIKHTPCRANYWHFSVRVFDENGDDIAVRNAHRNKPFSRDKAILKAARTAIRGLVIIGSPSAAPLNESVYVANV